jgi:hypothetical protein
MTPASIGHDRQSSNACGGCQIRFWSPVLLLTSQQELSKLTLANNGDRHAFAHVLDLAYGRKGQLKWSILKVRCVISCPYETLLNPHSLYSPTLLHQPPLESYHPWSARVYLCTVLSLRRYSYLLILAHLGRPPIHLIFFRRQLYRRGQVHPPRMLVSLDHSANVGKSTSAGAISPTNGNGCTLHLRSP